MKVKHMAPPIRSSSARSRNRSMTLILSVTLAPPEDDHERPLRLAEQSTQRGQLFLHEQAGDGGDQRRHSGGGGVRPVGGAEGVVHVDVGQAEPVPPPSSGSFFFSRGSKREFSSRSTSPGLHAGHRLLDRRAGELVDLAHRGSQQSGKAGGHRIEPEGVIGGVLGPAQVRARGSPWPRARAGRRWWAARPGCACRRRRPPSASGTLKSTRTKTRLPVTSTSRTVIVRHGALS